jgi:hypothetical protein
MRFKVSFMVFMALPVIVVLGCLAQPQGQPLALSSTPEDSLKRFLQDYVRANGVEEDMTQYVDAFVDLNQDGKKEVIVHIMGRWWCGSGGCETLVLQTEASSYKLITKMTITRPPISVLSSLSHGWRTLTVWVGGGGIAPYEAELQFDGKTYPMNPSVPPARRFVGREGREAVIPASAIDKAKPLYP